MRQSIHVEWCARRHALTEELECMVQGGLTPTRKSGASDTGWRACHTKLSTSSTSFALNPPLLWPSPSSPSFRRASSLAGPVLSASSVRKVSLNWSSYCSIRRARPTARVCASWAYASWARVKKSTPSVQDSVLRHTSRALSCVTRLVHRAAQVLRPLVLLPSYTQTFCALSYLVRACLSTREALLER